MSCNLDYVGYMYMASNLSLKSESFYMKQEPWQILNLTLHWYAENTDNWLFILTRECKIVLTASLFNRTWNPLAFIQFVYILTELGSVPPQRTWNWMGNS